MSVTFEIDAKGTFNTGVRHFLDSHAQRLSPAAQLQLSNLPRGRGACSHGNNARKLDISVR